MSQTDLGTASFPAERTGAFDPAPEYTRRLEESPVSRMRLWNGREVWLLTRYEDVRAALGDRSFSADLSRPGFPIVRPQLDRRSFRTFIRMDPPDHTYFRRMLTREFMIKRINAIRPTITRIVDDCLDDMAGQPQPVDLVSTVALPVPSMVICHLLGVPYEDHEFFQNRSRKLLSRRSSVEDAQQAADELREYLGRLVDSKQNDPGDDVLGRLVTDHQHTGRLQRDDLVSMALLLLVAGHETTANMIGLGTLALLEHPAQLQRLIADPALIPSAVEELLRFLTIVQFGIPRLATADTEIGGQQIRAGDGVIAMLSVANRDPAQYEQPDELDLDRNSRHHVAFGFGVHQCLGQPLARVELHIAFERLFGRFPSLRLAVPTDQVPLRHDMFIHGVHELPVAW